MNQLAEAEPNAVQSQTVLGNTFPTIREMIFAIFNQLMAQRINAARDAGAQPVVSVDLSIPLHDIDSGAEVEMAILQLRLAYSLQPPPAAIVLRISGPGGFVFAGDRLSQAILDLRQQTGIRTIALVTGQGQYPGADSAHAKLALSCDEIVIEHDQLSFGSIGTRAGATDLSRYYEQEGVVIDHFIEFNSLRKIVWAANYVGWVNSDQFTDAAESWGPVTVGGQTVHVKPLSAKPTKAEQAARDAALSTLRAYALGLRDEAIARERAEVAELNAAFKDFMLRARGNRLKRSGKVFERLFGADVLRAKEALEVGVVDHVGSIDSYLARTGIGQPHHINAGEFLYTAIKIAEVKFAQLLGLRPQPPGQAPGPSLVTRGTIEGTALTLH